MSSETLDLRSLAIIDAFTRAWESSRLDVASHWESHPERPLVLLAAIAAIDLQCRLARGEQATVEDYTGRFPSLTSDAALLATLRDAIEASRKAEEDEFATTPPPAAGDVERLGPLRPLDDSSSADTLVGTTVGGISIVRMIAEGGMGRVYEGRQQKPPWNIVSRVQPRRHAVGDGCV